MYPVRNRLRAVRPDSGRAAVQVVAALLGAITVVGGVTWTLVILTTMARSESGFAEGLAILVGSMYVIGGFVLLAAGLAVPQRPGDGIHFSPRQRLGLCYGIVAPVSAVLSAPIGATLLPTLPGPIESGLIALLEILLLTGPTTTVVVIGWRLRSGPPSGA